MQQKKPFAIKQKINTQVNNIIDRKDPYKNMKSLTPQQQETIIKIIDLLAGNETVNRETVGFLGVDWQSVPIDLLASLFEVSKRAVYLWLETDVPPPRNDDGTFNACAVLKWYIAREVAAGSRSTGNLKDEKTQTEIEILKEKLTILRNESIDVTLHDTILSSRASSLRAYFTDVFDKNIFLYANKSVDELRPMYQTMIQQAMQHYLEADNG